MGWIGSGENGVVRGGEGAGREEALLVPSGEEEVGGCWMVYVANSLICCVRISGEAG